MLLYIYIYIYLNNAKNKFIKRERESRLTLNNMMGKKRKEKKNRNNVIIEGKIVK